VSQLEDVRKATIQIVAEGSFVDPAGAQIASAGSGSGFIIDPSGLAVTNNHVVAGAALIRVWVGGESEPRNAVILGVSECSDLAVIDIEGDGYDYLEWYEGEVQPGLTVYAAGYPLGDPEFTLTRGIVSKGRAGGESTWASVDAVIEHDATINPGNSGGPLVSEAGTVIAVNYASSQGANQYFAIAQKEALQAVERLRSDENVDSIGINPQAVTLDSGLTGVWVASVESGSPADKAGIKGGDIIVQLEGLELAKDGTMADYCDILRTHKPEDTLKVQVVRFATSEVLEGQINGRELEQAFSMQQEGREYVEQGETDETISYVVVSDDSETIIMEIPESWSDVDGSAWTDDNGQVLGPALQASPDLQGFLDDQAPGAMFLATSLEGESFDAGEYLDLLDFSDTCSYEGRSEYEDALYAGLYDLYTDCGNTDNVLFVVVSAPEDAAFLTILVVEAMTEADLEAADRIFDSFEVIGDLP
jgi:serine protease Do